MLFKTSYLLVLLYFIAAPTYVSAVKNSIVVEGEYTYYIPYNIARDKAEQTVMQRAMVSALAKEFGTVVSETSQLDMKSSKEGENVDFWSSASTLVRGEWIETIGNPEFTPSIENGNFVISCRIKGRAREISTSQAELEIHIMTNPSDPNSETSSFMDGDKLILQFTSPIDGFLTVYLEGEDGRVMRLLPYTDESIPTTKIKANKRYCFFTTSDGTAEQYNLYTDKTIERNNIFIVFSPNEYVKPIDYSTKDGMDLRSLSSQAFRDWVTKLRSADSKLQFIIKPITISGRIE